MLKFLREMLSDDDDRASSTRVSVMVGVVIMSLVVLFLTAATVFVMIKTANACDFTKVNCIIVNPDGGLLMGILGIYAALCGGVYATAKFSDNSVTKAGMPQKEPIVVPPIAPSPININMNPPATDSTVKDVSMKVEGDVNLKN